ncbi:MAG: cell division protein ZapA [Paludibacteraceae bacterium]|nr:cell division protein ZapA [Paludibacteraceae bacterium]
MNTPSPTPEDELQHINLRLDAHTVSLRVPRKVESLYRAAGKMLNDRYAYYRTSQPKVSAEQLWMYVALEAAVNLQSDAREKDLEPVEKELRELNKRLRDVLDKEE